jgi:hypothetical protein
MWEVKNVDAMLCSVQTGTQEGQASRSHSLRMRLGVVAKTAIVIEYYLPQKFPKQSGKFDSGCTAREDHFLSGA